MTADPRASGHLGHTGFFAKCRWNFPSASAVLRLLQTKHNGPDSVGTAGMSQADPEAAGRGPEKGGGIEEPLPFLVWLSLPEHSPVRPHSGQLIRPGVIFVYASMA